MAIARTAVSESTSSGWTNVGTSYDLSHTCVSGDTKLVVLIQEGSIADNVTGVTYNGVTMTQAKKQALSNLTSMYLYYLDNPASGAHNINVTFASSETYGIVCGASYTGTTTGSAPQQTAGGNTANAGPESLTVTATTTRNWDWLVGGFYAGGATGAAGTGTTKIAGAVNTAFMIDSNGIRAAGSNSMQGTNLSYPAGAWMTLEQSQSDLEVNLVSYWKLDESSGNAADSVGSNTLTNTGTVTYSAAKINNGADFGTSNTTKWLTTSSLILASPYTDRTYSFWFRPKDLPDGDDNWIFDHSYDTENREIGITYGRSGSTYTLGYKDNGSGTGGGSYSRTGQLTEDAWYHLAMVRSSGVYSAYLNGVYQGGWTNTDTTGASGPGDGFTIGTLLRYTPIATDGMIDEFGVWSRALTPTEVAGLYNDGLGSQYAFTDLKPAKVLVVAGGGSGGHVGSAGGGGAGGVVYNSSYLLSQQAYTVTVGNGGTGGTSENNGSDSVFSTITSVGGGKGATSNLGNNAGNGGSGGGGSYNNTKGTGTTGQGYAGGDGYASPSFAGGGGGGAGAVGGNGTSTNAGVGGAGIADASIGGLLAMTTSGVSGYIAGGGGSGGDYYASRSVYGVGGGGGGGDGGQASTNGVDATANTGGGGGGASQTAAGASTNAGSGGSGIVIIAYTTADFTHSYSGTSTTGTSGSETWVKMTTSGTLTLSAAGGARISPLPTYFRV